MSSPKTITFRYKNGEILDLVCNTNYSLGKLMDMCSTELRREIIEGDSFIDWLISKRYYSVKKVSN